MSVKPHMYIHTYMRTDMYAVVSKYIVALKK